MKCKKCGDAGDFYSPQLKSMVACDCGSLSSEIIEGFNRIRAARAEKIKRSNERREVEARKPYADD